MGFLDVIKAPFKFAANIGKGVYSGAIKPVAAFAGNTIGKLVDLPKSIIEGGNRNIDHALNVGNNAVDKAAGVADHGLDILGSPLVLIGGAAVVLLVLSKK